MLKEEPYSRGALWKYMQFLMQDKDQRNYGDLADFLEWYGSNYLLPSIKDVLKSLPPHIQRVAEFGPGTGWLAGELSQMLFTEVYAIDKRNLLGQGLRGVKFMQKNLERNPEELFIPHPALIVANQFLHCVDNPQEVIHAFRRKWWLVVEPHGGEPFLHWFGQMALFGAKPLTQAKIYEMFHREGFELEEDVAPSLWISLWRPSESDV